MTCVPRRSAKTAATAPGLSPAHPGSVDNFPLLQLLRRADGGSDEPGAWVADRQMSSIANFSIKGARQLPGLSPNPPDIPNGRSRPTDPV